MLMIVISKEHDTQLLRTSSTYDGHYMLMGRLQPIEFYQMQALGLSVLMARAGLAIPAAHPVVLPPFTSVLADIGDTQSLQSSLSTFSGHLMRIKVNSLLSRSFGHILLYPASDQHSAMRC